MAHYDGPVFQSDDKPATKAPQHTNKQAGKANSADVQPTYHSVDPMSQFVTPPSTITRQAKPVVDYAAVRRNLRRTDAEVVLMATDADQAVPFADEVAANQPVEVQTSAAAAETAAATAAGQVDDETYSALHKKVTSDPETVAEPTTDADILSLAADAAESEHIPATLTELAEQGRIQFRQVQNRAHTQKKRQETGRPIFTGGTRPNRYNIHQAFAEYKSSQTGKQKRHH